MSSNNSQTNDIYNISSAEDLSCDTAANIQGGADLEVYRHKDLVEPLGSYNFGSNQLSSNSDNQISSVKILAGRWRFYEDGGPVRVFGRFVTLGRGNWNITTLNDKISAIKRF